ncbi:MAG TPA: MgtC/SapB family protein [Terracidiphilus sp.]|jgi:putative Mg2+ transporter-C (MgtC) family protein|nr:MgtC/SapB family protein [Terracidiphilus sp.]
MTAPLAQIAQPFHFDSLQQMVVMDHAIGRLLLACALGGAIGLEREINRKAAGVRTNLLICMGCAFFTLLSAVLAGDANPDKGRVASNIVQGIGFLGAGLILHNRSRVSGLTSAASVFVVASIGMACGAGLYAAAVIAALVVVVSLELVGFLERRANLKLYPLVYEARGLDQTLMLSSILDAMDAAGERLASVDRDAIGALQRVSFQLTATKKQHERLRTRLLAEPAIDALKTFRDPEED